MLTLLSVFCFLFSVFCFRISPISPQYRRRLFENQVQTVENVEKKKKLDQDQQSTNATAGDKSEKESLTKVTNDVTKLWRDTILATDESLAEIYLQVKTIDASTGAEGDGVDGGGDGAAKKKQKILTKRAGAAHKMLSFGMLGGGATSMDLLRGTQLDIKKMVHVSSSKFDPNITYPSMLMMEMVTDCTAQRTANLLALHGMVQQSYDTLVTQAEVALPLLMPQYDLTYPEFRHTVDVEKKNTPKKNTPKKKKSVAYGGKALF
jgi:hypothetical protein